MKTLLSPSHGLLLAFLSLAGQLSADEQIGLQFLSARQAAGLGPAEIAGTTLTAQANWNYTDNSVNGATVNVLAPSVGVLVDDTGAATTTTVSWTAGGTWNTNNGITTPHSKLLNGYIDNTGGGSTIDFTGIPYAAYSVVVYFGSDGNGRTGQINSTTAGIAYSYTTGSSFGRGVTPADYRITTDTGAGNPVANYCIFTNQTSADFSLNIIRGNNNSGFHAVQIVEGGDTDGDTMPDSYETANGLNPLVDDRTGDLDVDGSTNFDEFVRNTKPNVADTDADGLLDGAENRTGLYVSTTDAGTEPLIPDTDKDGINDGAEPATGAGDAFVTNPVKRDTDGDGYTDGYEVSKATDPTNLLSNNSIVSEGVVNLNFTGGYNGGSASVMGLAGAGSFARTTWNNKSGVAGFYSPLVDEANAALDAGVTWNAAGTYSVVDLTTNVPMDADAAMMSGYLDTSDISTTTVLIENVPYRRYDVVLYLDGDSGDGSRSGSYTVNGVTRTGIRDASNWPVAVGGGIFVEAIGSSSTGNYLVFRNLSGGTVSISATPTTVAAFRAPLNAVQIFGTVDGDGDGMPDQYEIDNDFNPLSAADGPLDADSDGLTNTQEYIKGTKALNFDSDNDGIQDGAETGTGTYVSAANTGSDPLSPDSDNDGVNDGAEVNIYLSNPLVRDSDLDGYPDGYEVTYGTQPANAASPAINAVKAIGVHFNSSVDRDLNLTEDAGFILTRQTGWNNADGSPNGTTDNILSPTAATLTDNLGNPTSTTVTWTSSSTYTTTNGTANGDSKLMGGYLDNTGNGNVVTITNIPYERYDIIAYFGSDGNNRTGSIASTTAAQEFFYNTAANIGAAGFAKDGFRETTSIVAGTNPQANFCRFIAQTSSTFEMQVNRGSNNSGFFGFQIVDRTLPRIPVTSFTRNAGGSVTIVWQSQPVATYLIQRSEDLTVWTELNPSLTSGGTSTTFTDTTIPANTPKVFYRIFQN